MVPMRRDSGVGPTESERPDPARSDWRAWVTTPQRLPVSLLGVVIGGFLFGYLLSVLLAFPSEDASTDLSQVPEVIGKTAEEARRLLERWGLGYEEVAALHNALPSGTVLAQGPLPSQLTRPGSAVSVTLSLGPKERPVPDVVGLSYRQAEIALQRAGYKSDVTRVDAEADVGQVVGTRPEPGTPLRLTGRVRLLVSAGPAMVETPDLLSRSLAEAQAAAERLGLKLGEVTQDSSSLAAPGTVLGQRPIAGTVVARATAISVTVATVPPEPADTSEASGEEESESRPR